jgi:hypothetical protein
VFREIAFKRGGIEAAQQLEERDFATLKGAKRNSLLFAGRFSAINLLLGCVCRGGCLGKVRQVDSKTLRAVPSRYIMKIYKIKFHGTASVESDSLQSADHS